MKSLNQEGEGFNSRPARALWFEGERVASLREEEVHAPGLGQVYVQALHSLVSAGSELNLYRGEGNLPSLLLPNAAGTLPFPVKFAYQVVGRVEAAGQGSFAPGDRVFCVHPHQERFTMQAAAPFVYKLPEHLDNERASFLGMFSVALQVHLTTPTHPGDCVVVAGLGLIGTFAAYLARLSAGKLIVIDPIAARRERAKWIGADACVSPEEAPDAILRLSKGRGADLYIETSGAPAALQSAINSTGNLATICVAAWYGTRRVTLSLSPEFHLRGHRIVSVWVGELGGDAAARWDWERKMEVCSDYLSRLDVSNLISHRVPFERAPEAYSLLDKNPAEALAVMLDYDQATNHTR